MILDDSENDEREGTAKQKRVSQKRKNQNDQKDEGGRNKRLKAQPFSENDCENDCEWSENDEAEPPLISRQTFSSWDEFHEELDKYSKETFQIFRVRTSKTVATYNKELADKHAKKKSENEIYFYPDSYEYYTKIMRCTHGHKARQRGN